MRNTRLITLFAICVLIYILSLKTTFFSPLVRFAEQAIVVPVRRLEVKILGKKVNENEESLSSLKLLSLKEQIAQLQKENASLREQLGAIPEKSTLYPVQVIWETDTELFVSLPYKPKHSLVGQPVVYGEVLVGMVIRQGESVAVIRKPIFSGFKANAVTDRQTKGIIQGQFNERLVFATELSASVASSDSVYYVDPVNGWNFLVGKVKKIERNERLPTKSAVIDYQLDSLLLKTIFIVL